MWDSHYETTRNNKQIHLMALIQVNLCDLAPEMYRLTQFDLD